MTDELNGIFETIKGWTVEEIQSILYHRAWTQTKMTPFKESGKSKPPPEYPPKSFDSYRKSLAEMLNQGLDDVDAEQSAKIIVCSTFLLVDDTTIDGDDKFSQMRLRDGVHSKLLELLNEMDETAQSCGQSIQKRQLFYALFKQREDSAFTIKKVTWKNVTSDWGPKIVMSDGKNYYYIFSNVDEFETLQERYNIAAALGRAEQYLSNYDKDENEFNLKILKVLATEDCLTLAEYFEQHKIGLKGKSSGKRLFERLGEDFFRKELNTELVVKSDELKKILPRLMQEEEANACLRAILSQEKKWMIPRTQIQLNNQTYFAVHGDEWGGNFLVSKFARQVFVIDFEDVIFANANDAENIVGVGGDLSSRIFNATKDGDRTFLPIGLSTFASIGRLLAAVVQYHSRYDELKNENIREIIHRYTESFAKALDLSSDKHQVVKSNYWDSDFEQLILLHAWDWALYWQKKDTFPQQSFDVFVKEIKKLLCGGHADKTDSTHKSSPPDTTKIKKMPSENRDAQSKKTFNDKSIELADDAARGHYTNGDFAEAEQGWRHAIQLVPDSTSTEDLGYFWYWVTRASYLNKSEASKTLDSINRCIDLCKSGEDNTWLMEALLFLAHLHREENEINQARHVLNQVVGLYFDEEFEEEPDAFDVEHLLDWPGGRHRFFSDTVLCQIKRQVANLLRDEGDLGGAAKLYENLMNYYKGTMKHDAEDNARANLGILKSFMGEYEESDALQNQCLEYRRKEYNKVNDGDSGEITKALRNLGLNAMSWAKELEQAEKTRQLEKAKSYFEECIHLLKTKEEAFFENPEHKKEFIQFNSKRLHQCELEIKIGDIYSQYSNNEQIKREFEKLLLSFPGEENTIRLNIIDHSDNWSDVKCQIELIDLSKCESLEIAEIALTMFKFEKYENAKRFILKEISKLDHQTKIYCCMILEEIHIKELKSTNITGAVKDYHTYLCRRYGVEYESDTLNAAYEFNREQKRRGAGSEFTKLLDAIYSGGEYESIIAGWVQLSGLEIRELAIDFLNHILLGIKDIIITKGDAFDISEMRKKVSHVIFEQSERIERVYTNPGSLPLHLLHFHVVVCAFSILERDETILARKKTLRKQMHAYAKRTKEFKQNRLTEQDASTYRLIVNMCIKPEEYPLVDFLPKVIDQLQKSENEGVKVQFLSIVLHIIQTSPIFGSPCNSQPLGAKLNSRAKKCLTTLVDKLETWLIDEPELWGAQTVIVSEGDWRRELGIYLLKLTKGGDEDHWPDVFKQ